MRIGARYLVILLLVTVQVFYVPGVWARSSSVGIGLQEFSPIMFQRVKVRGSSVSVASIGIKSDSKFLISGPKYLQIHIANAKRQESSQRLFLKRQEQIRVYGWRGGRFTKMDIDMQKAGKNLHFELIKNWKTGRFRLVGVKVDPLQKMAASFNPVCLPFEESRLSEQIEALRQAVTTQASTQGLSPEKKYIEENKSSFFDDETCLREGARTKTTTPEQVRAAVDSMKTALAELLSTMHITGTGNPGVEADRSGLACLKKIGLEAAYFRAGASFLAGARSGVKSTLPLRISCDMDDGVEAAFFDPSSKIISIRKTPQEVRNKGATPVERAKRKVFHEMLHLSGIEHNPIKGADGKTHDLCQLAEDCCMDPVNGDRYESASCKSLKAVVDFQASVQKSEADQIASMNDYARLKAEVTQAFGQEKGKKLQDGYLENESIAVKSALAKCGEKLAQKDPPPQECLLDTEKAVLDNFSDFYIARGGGLPSGAQASAISPRCIEAAQSLEQSKVKRALDLCFTIAKAGIDRELKKVEDWIASGDTEKIRSDAKILKANWQKAERSLLEMEKKHLYHRCQAEVAQFEASKKSVWMFFTEKFPSISHAAEPDSEECARRDQIRASVDLCNKQGGCENRTTVPDAPKMLNDIGNPQSDGNEMRSIKPPVEIGSVKESEIPFTNEISQKEIERKAQEAIQAEGVVGKTMQDVAEKVARTIIPAAEAKEDMRTDRDRVASAERAQKRADSIPLAQKPIEMDDPTEPARPVEQKKQTPVARNQDSDAGTEAVANPESPRRRQSGRHTVDPNSDDRREGPSGSGGEGAQSVQYNNSISPAPVSHSPEKSAGGQAQTFDPVHRGQDKSASSKPTDPYPTAAGAHSPQQQPSQNDIDQPKRAVARDSHSPSLNGSGPAQAPLQRESSGAPIPTSVGGAVPPVQARPTGAIEIKSKAELVQFLQGDWKAISKSIGSPEVMSALLRYQIQVIDDKRRQRGARNPLEIFQYQDGRLKRIK